MRIRDVTSLAGVLLVSAGLAGCASQASAARPSAAGTVPTIGSGSAPADEGGLGDPDAEGPVGRPAGIRIIWFGGQPTYWTMHCPTDSPSPLRKQCSLTRADAAPPP